jgi:heavy metal sensor kinase
VKPLKLRTKLTLSFALLVALVLAVSGMAFYKLLAYQLESALTQELLDRAAALRGYLRFDGDKPRFVYDTGDAEEAFFIARATRYFQIYDLAGGRLLARSQDLDALGFQYTAEELRDLVDGPDLTEIHTDQIDLLVHNYVLRFGADRSYLFQVGVTLEPRETALNRLVTTSLFLMPLGIILALISGWWMTHRLLRPVEALGAAAREISISRLDRRLPVRGTRDELDRLAEMFNSVFARLETAVQQMKDFTAAISHELRTPLTVLRGEAEVALAEGRRPDDYRRVLESQLEEIDKLSRMVNQMMVLAKAESGQIEFARRHIDLGGLARLLVDQMEPLATTKGVSLQSRMNGPVWVLGDEGWLERALLNVIDNALKFTRRGGHVQVCARAEAPFAILEVSDDGIGISPQALPHVFERFYREDRSRSKVMEGTGLGLSLVEWIVRQHEGQVSVESQPERGTTLRIQLALVSSPT